MVKTMQELFKENKSNIVKGNFTLARPYEIDTEEEVKRFLLFPIKYGIFFEIGGNTYKEDFYLDNESWSWKDSDSRKIVLKGMNQSIDFELLRGIEPFSKRLDNFIYEKISLLMFAEEYKEDIYYRGKFGMYNNFHVNKDELEEFQRIHLNGKTIEEKRSDYYRSLNSGSRSQSKK